MTEYDLRGAASRNRMGISGLLPACLIALMLMVLQLSAIRWGLGIAGLGEMRAVNNRVIATTVPLILQGILFSAALAGYFSVSADDRQAGVIGDASQRTLVLVALFCMTMLPLLSGRPLIGAPHSTNLFLLVLAAELAVGAGFCAGYAALRHPALKAMIAAAGVSLPLALLGRAVLSHMLFSNLTVTASGIGLDEAERTVTALLDWTPRVHGMAIALAVLISGLLLPPMRSKAVWLLGVAVAPLVITAFTVLLGVLGSGFSVIGAYGESPWLYFSGGAAIGYLVALPVVHIIRSE